MKLTMQQDAIGQAVYDCYRGLGGYEIIERSDGFIQESGGPRIYLSEYRSWPRYQKLALRHVSGRVLDIGCNAGRHALYLQERGHSVLGIDISPLAIKTAGLRGLKARRVLPITGVSRHLGSFETIFLLGNNFGLFATWARARWLLRRLRTITAEDARLIVESLDVYRTDEPEHLEYQAENRRLGRMSGQIRMRARYKQFATPWFDYLMVSQQEMESILEGTGWITNRFFNGPGGSYAAVIKKETLGTPTCAPVASKE